LPDRLNAYSNRCSGAALVAILLSLLLLAILWILLWPLFGTEGGTDFQETLKAGSYFACGSRRSTAGAATRLRAAQDTVNAGKSVGGAPFPSASHDPCRSRGQPATMRSHSGSRLPVNSGGASFSSACLRCGLFVGSAVFRSIRLITRSIAAISRSTRRSNQRTPPNAMTSAVSITTLAQPKIWLPIYGFLPCSTPVAALGALL